MICWLTLEVCLSRKGRRQRYYTWSTGIYQDARNGLTISPTLQTWMEAGGARGWRQAAARLNLDR